MALSAAFASRLGQICDVRGGNPERDFDVTQAIVF